MEEEKEVRLEKEEDRKERDKKNTFTLIYILTGIVIIALLGVVLYSFMVK